ncbi:MULTISPECIES: hypothetical protein [Microbispora]|uniref:Uncharacterized protein n=4 Tax=Microbispora TaxID=2005 RepID=A0ABY3LQQ7_9ACTN|nr:MULTISPECIES: hypothetical protein [Microbispora]GLW27024.1 hypothetical protein Mame01_70660 [Microbispora amethystogenes]KAA9373240.1 hypothetical protein F5972_36105 [Microbispora cellulosiformans]MBO4270282.1 hypothetical protein [Microbispora triticiradicis]RGA02053.1 hypothetical protein DI270_026265 [Microbispora triticiradicis]TLP50809.1 hypothetical protein FED44_34860 [Microbispora fusca]
MTPDDEARDRQRALELLRRAFPDYRIVYGGGRWAAAAAGDPPTVWFAETPASLCGQLFTAQLRSGGTIAPLRVEESDSQCAR